MLLTSTVDGVEATLAHADAPYVEDLAGSVLGAVGSGGTGEGHPCRTGHGLSDSTRVVRRVH